MAFHIAAAAMLIADDELAWMKMPELCAAGLDPWTFGLSFGSHLHSLVVR